MVKSRTGYKEGHARPFFLLRTVGGLMSQLPLLVSVVPFIIPAGAFIMNRLNLGKTEKWNWMGTWYRQLSLS